MGKVIEFPIHRTRKSIERTIDEIVDKYKWGDITYEKAMEIGKTLLKDRIDVILFRERLWEAVRLN